MLIAYILASCLAVKRQFSLDIRTEHQRGIYLLSPKPAIPENLPKLKNLHFSAYFRFSFRNMVAKKEAGIQCSDRNMDNKLIFHPHFYSDVVSWSIGDLKG